MQRDVIQTRANTEIKSIYTVENKKRNNRDRQTQSERIRKGIIETKVKHIQVDEESKNNDSIKCGLETEKKKKEAQKYKMGSEKTYMILRRERETSLIKRAESCLEKIFIDKESK